MDAFEVFLVGGVVLGSKLASLRKNEEQTGVSKGGKKPWIL